MAKDSRRQKGQPAEKAKAGDVSVALSRNGWTLYKYVAFGRAYDQLVSDVEALRDEDPEGFSAHPKAKILKRITDIILHEIPADPSDPKYRQGNALGGSNKAWFRAKFLSRFRLFYRFDTRTKVIIYCWMNDEDTLRKAGSKTDPYAVFADMIGSGHPPGSWDDLIRVVTDEKAPQTTPWPSDQSARQG